MGGVDKQCIKYDSIAIKPNEIFTLSPQLQLSLKLNNCAFACCEDEQQMPVYNLGWYVVFHSCTVYLSIFLIYFDTQFLYTKRTPFLTFFFIIIKTNSIEFVCKSHNK